MKKTFRLLQNYIFRRSEIDIILFKILGIGGIAVSVLTGIYSLTQSAFISAVADFGAAVVSVFLLYYVEKTGKYVIGYVITEIAVFMGVFTVLFLTNGGIDGALPFFFSFALIFTFLMFQDRMLILMETLLTVYYLALCVITYLNPGLLWHAAEGTRRLSELLVGIFFSALPMGFIILFYIEAYKKQKKKAEEANVAKGVFLANMSHELRTPINSVLGFDEIILRDSNDEQVKEYARNIRNSGRQLLEVINQILDFSRLESGREKIVDISYNLDELISDLKTYGENETKRKGLEFSLEYENNGFNYLSGDREKIRRVVLNLLSNAVKYTIKGKVILRVSCRELKEDIIELHIDVEDTGVGIKEEDLESLFHSYERIDLITNQKIQGTGLGLAISKHIIELLGGNITIKSEYEKGSIFSFCLEQKKGEENQDISSGNEDVHFLAPDASVLVVDDNELNRKLIGILLEDTLVKLDMAESANECLELVKRKKYDIILMDYMMPVMDGARAMELIRESEEKEDLHTPIFVLTADVVEQAEKRLLERGFDAYISKPVNFTDLKKKMVEFIPASKLEITRLEDNNCLNRNELDEYIKALKPYDIHIADGIRYVENNIKQFSVVAKYYIKNSGESISRLKKAISENDMNNLRLICHSLKGNAKNVGAIELNELSKRMEEKAKEADMSFITQAMNLIVFEWERSVEGLKVLLDILSEKRPELFGDDVYDTGDCNYTYEQWNSITEDLLEEIKRDIDLYQSKAGIDHTSQLIMHFSKASKFDEKSFDYNGEMNVKLNQLRKAFEEMEYEVAEDLINNMGTKIDG